MSTTKTYLHARSDGYFEAPNGQFAVCMQVATARNGDMSYLQFDPGDGKTSIRLEWPTDDKVQLFEPEIARAMTYHVWAIQPGEAELEWLRALLEKMDITSTQEVSDVTSGALLNPQIAGEIENPVPTDQEIAEAKAAENVAEEAKAAKVVAKK